jgi:hypothetical protein
MLNPFLTFLNILKWKGYYWLPGYYLWLRQNKKISRTGDIHVMFAMVDHFEPSRKKGALGVQELREWCEKYAEIAGQYKDPDGVHPQHSWFYRYDYPNFECIKILSEYVLKGFGEIEFHLHHGNDTSESFDKTIKEGLEWFNRCGAMLSSDESAKRYFAYIAGNWALDNGRRKAELSGVNNELAILNKNNCYADFTFPAFATNAQPRQVNSLYYAKDDPRPKSYNTGSRMQVGGHKDGDLLIFEGPLYVNWNSRHIDYASFENFTPYERRRIDYWFKAGIHVQGKPEWIFVKLHTHGMQSKDTFLSRQLHQLCADLEQWSAENNIGLHYVTAREAYNIARAAEAGQNGNPAQYRDYAISKPVNRFLYCSQPVKIEKFTPEHAVLFPEPGSHTALIFNQGLLAGIEGSGMKRIDIRTAGPSVLHLKIEGAGQGKIRFHEQYRYRSEATQIEVNFPINERFDLLKR